MADTYLLMEDDNFLLLEDGGLIILDSASDVTYWAGEVLRKHEDVSPCSYQVKPPLRW